MPAIVRAGIDVDVAGRISPHSAVPVMPQIGCDGAIGAVRRAEIDGLAGRVPGRVARSANACAGAVSGDHGRRPKTALDVGQRLLDRRRKARAIHRAATPLTLRSPLLRHLRLSPLLPAGEKIQEGRACFAAIIGDARRGAGRKGERDSNEGQDTKHRNGTPAADKKRIHPRANVTARAWFRPAMRRIGASVIFRARPPRPLPR